MFIIRNIRQGFQCIQKHCGCRAKQCLILAGNNSSIRKFNGKVAINYNRDVEIFPVLQTIFKTISGTSPYQSPTDMGVNMAGNCIFDDEAVKKAAREDMLPSYHFPVPELSQRSMNALSEYNHSCHLEAYGKVAINYNRDVEIFPVLQTIFKTISGTSPYQSPTDMGVNMAGNCIFDDEAVKKAAREDMLPSYHFPVPELSQRSMNALSEYNHSCRSHPH